MSPSRSCTLSECELPELKLYEGESSPPSSPPPTPPHHSSTSEPLSSPPSSPPQPSDYDNELKLAPCPSGPHRRSPLCDDAYCLLFIHEEKKEEEEEKDDDDDAELQHQFSCSVGKPHSESPYCTSECPQLPSSAHAGAVSFIYTSACPIAGRHNGRPNCDYTCDHSPSAPSPSTTSSTETETDPWNTTPTCPILGRHEKGPNCDYTCDHSPSAPNPYQTQDDQDMSEDDEEDDEYHAKQRFRNSPKSKRRIIELSKRRKSARGKVEKTGIKSSRGQMRVELCRKMVVERWELPKWRKFQVFQHSLLGM